MCFNCIIGNTQLIQYQFLKSFVFQLVESAILKKIKVVSIEHLKQKLSLDNKCRCYNDVYKSKTVPFSLCRRV